MDTNLEREIPIPMAPIGRKSLVDAVVETLTARILRGDMRPGDALPSENELADRLGVGRSAVREALSRLATARLISMRHGGGKRILDYRHSAGLELLPSLLVEPGGRVDPLAVASVMEMRSALAPDIARLAAMRTTAPLTVRLRETVAHMHQAAGQLGVLQDLAERFWSDLVDGSANIAYRLAFNSLRASYADNKTLFTQILVPETTDIDTYERIATAVEHGDGARAESLARALVRRGEEAIKALFAAPTPAVTERVR